MARTPCRVVVGTGQPDRRGVKNMHLKSSLVALAVLASLIAVPAASASTGAADSCEQPYNLQERLECATYGLIADGADAVWDLYECLVNWGSCPIVPAQ